MKKTFRRLTHAACLGVALLTGACGGNYSNDDLEFQSATPAREDLALTLAPPLRPNSSTAFVDTYQMARKLDATVAGVLSLIEAVRRHSPTRRAGDTRIWGPFDGERPGVEHQVVMTRVPQPVSAEADDGYRFDYQVQSRRKARLVAPWLTVISGSFTPTAGGLRWGNGRISFTTLALRQNALPVEDENLVSIEIEYQHRRWLELNATVVAFPEGLPRPVEPATARFHFVENPDTNLAMFTFMWRGNDANVTAAVMTSMWRLTDFAGRADLVVTEGTATGAEAKECWGPDTLLLYRHRDWEPTGSDIGTPQSCLVAAAVTRPQL